MWVSWGFDAEKTEEVIFWAKAASSALLKVPLSKNNLQRSDAIAFIQNIMGFVQVLSRVTKTLSACQQC